MSGNKTQPTAQSVDTFLDAVEPERKREEARTLDALFRRVTGWQPQIWGPSLIGYGIYHYRYESGREGDFLATGFSPRKSAHSIYILPGYADFQPLLDRLGKHSHGKSCLYVKTLADIDLEILAELIEAGVRDLPGKYEVKPT
ncbi:hypothetical protein GCM10011367_12320 [Marinicauda pacifica]|uniref:DUF1801 domain-containing protein n=1 Tax=Marinicauda pacifica TaxID=1133559 RepID=A0A4S2HFG9_9PROT|nr:DUF1801 domain-containing protein [Marinicauda pacifica]TGY94854.1 DUF1801 domain-containing protein [Marinicauda pacifica]GGE39391.1 hypothetical protein GCM10011367_12320 [Marinicauda pacifica]